MPNFISEEHISSPCSLRAMEAWQLLFRACCTLQKLCHHWGDQYHYSPFLKSSPSQVNGRGEEGDSLLQIKVQSKEQRCWGRKGGRKKSCYILPLVIRVPGYLFQLFDYTASDSLLNQPVINSLMRKMWAINVRQGEREYEGEGYTLLEEEELKLIENIGNKVASVWVSQWLSSLWDHNDGTRGAQER